MIMAVIALWIFVTHVMLLILTRHLVRRRHFPFFVEIRKARGKPASYLHFLWLYYSWFDPATFIASMHQTGFRRDQVLSLMIYGLGLGLSLFVLLLIFAFAKVYL